MYYTADFVAFDYFFIQFFFSQGLNEAAKGSCLRKLFEDGSTKSICKSVHNLNEMKSRQGKYNFLWGGGRFRAWKKKKHFKERGEQTGGGWNFERSVAGKTMRKEGLGTVGLLQDVVSGRQEYRKTAREETC